MIDSDVTPPLAFDVVLVGGGLQNTLISLALSERQPGLRIALVERSAQPGGNHTWCFHAGDVPERARRWVDELVVHRWPRHDVSFPEFSRRLEEPYAAITSTRLAEVVASRFRDGGSVTVLTNANASVIEANRVVLSDGRTLTAKHVVDARGPGAMDARGASGFQKFVGLELEVGAHSIEHPTLMDATVPQIDGFRFFYVLPLSPTRLLVEDTYFSDSPELDVSAVRRRILAHAKELGFSSSTVVREESGVLPMPCRTAASDAIAPFRAGYAGGWFHPTTAYSFPVALRLAVHLADTPIDDWFGPSFMELRADHRAQFRFGTFLNRLLFTGFSPENRRNVLARFYRLPAPTIRRFYAMNTTPGDRLRVLCGRPPRGLSATALYRGAVS